MSTNGRPIPPLSEADERRFWSKAALPDPETGCMNWLAGKFSNGYGKFWLQGATYRAHRISWTLENGPVPQGMVLDHAVCRSKACVNPSHMRVCTQRDNLMAPDGSLRMLVERERSKTHCPAGHAYDAANTYVTPEGFRQCRACQREHKRAYRLRKRLASVDSTGTAADADDLPQGT